MKSIGDLPAFPLADVAAENRATGELTWIDAQPGMSYRQWLVGLIVSQFAGYWHTIKPKECADAACDLADGLIARLDAEATKTGG